MNNLKKLIAYAKIAVLKTKVFSCIISLLCAGDFFVPQLSTQCKLNIAFCLLFVFVFVVLIKTIFLVLQDTIAPKIIRPFSNKSLEDKYGILFITESAVYKSIYEIGSLISLVYVDDEVESIIGEGTVINIQSDGKMQIGVNVLNEFAEYKTKIQNNQKNIYIKPRKMGILS